ncbi:MAG: hypothetical protein HOA85_04630, partial [Candidatus Pacebacteria bacterium]|nr:hypothetical protein [Candidatus Paceibacterota bacterium]
NPCKRPSFCEQTFSPSHPRETQYGAGGDLQGTSPWHHSSSLDLIGFL